MDKFWIFAAQIVVVLLLLAFKRYERRPDPLPNEPPLLPPGPRGRRKRPALRAKPR